MTGIAEGGGGVGGQLRRLRLAARLTQEELAHKSGLSIRTISDAERGRTSQPRSSTLRLIAEALNLSDSERDAIDGTGPWRVPAQLPADLADFTGRSAQVEQLTGLLTGRGTGEAPGAVVVSAVSGAGGIGKSALAVHVAHHVAEHFPDGQLYLNLRGSSAQPVAPGDALARLLRDLGADPAVMAAEEGERAAGYRSLAADRRLLIMLDDARDAAQVRLLLPGTAACAVLITSRSSLLDLESARLMDLDALADTDAAALFARIIGPARAAAEPQAVREVLAACAGLPLAIRIAAARLAARPRWTIAALAGRLGDASRRLDELQAGDLAVRASFMVSYASAASAGLAPDRAFRMLGLAGGPDISLPAAAALLGVSGTDAEQALETLVDAHLLQSVVPGRYRFHDLLRVYAAERALAEVSAAERDVAVARMLRWYLRTAAAAALLADPHRMHLPLEPDEPDCAPLAFTSYATALAWLDAEQPNLVTAVGQAARQGEHELAWKLPATLWDMFSLRGHIDDWISTHQTGLASARLLQDKRAERLILSNLGGAYLRLRQPQAAIDCLRLCPPIAHELGLVRSVAIDLHNLGLTLTELDRAGEAMEPLQESLRMFAELGNRNAEAETLMALGGAYRQRGQFSEAIAHYQLALDAARETGDLVIEGSTLAEMSTVRLRLGQLGAAIGEATQAVELSRQTGNRFDEAQALAVLGRAQRDQGQPAQARRSWLDAVAIYNELGQPQAGDVTAELDALEISADHPAPA